MKNAISKFWNNTSDIGIEYAQDVHQVKTIRTGNRIKLVCLGSTIGYAAVMLFYNQRAFFLAMAVVFIGQIFAFYLAKIGKHYHSRLINAIIMPSTIFFCSIFLGEDSGTHHLLFLSILGPFAAFNEHEKRTLSFIIALISLYILALHFYFFRYYPPLDLDPVLINFISDNNIIVMVIFLTIFLRSMTLETYKAEKEIVEQNSALAETKNALLTQNEKLETAMKVRNNFLSNVSHEIRTPLNAIMGFTEIMKDGETSEENVDHIHKASETLLHLVNDLLDISKIEDDTFKLEYKDFSISEIINEVQPFVERSAARKNIDLVFSDEKNYHGYVVGDSLRFNQILLNLLSNAIKFTKVGYVRCSVKKVKEEGNIEYIQIEVKDTGIGIKEENLESIFESFNQTQLSITKEYGGTGLGLTIVKKLVQAMDGTIQVHSTYGQGSTFAVVIPFQKGHRIQKETPLDNKPIEIINKGLKILIVDDNEINLLLLKKLLNNLALDPDTASSGFEALKKMSHTKYDLVLLDIQMPIMSGFDVFEEMKTMGIDKSTKVIAITADAFEATKMEVYAAGMDDYMTKPINKKILSNKINDTVVHQ